MDIATEKSRARIEAQQRRAEVHTAAAAPELIRHFPSGKFHGAIIAGFWPMEGEIDIKPLMLALHEAGQQLALPCTPRIGNPLVFREWAPADPLKTGSFNTREPFPTQAEVFPDFILAPLLAFTDTGERLGYGGGFYDRTLAVLRAKHVVFACGVAYAAQEAASLPTDEYDQKLDGILTETGFRKF